MKTVLIVDDAPTTLAGLGAVVSRAGFEVQTAPGAEEALCRLRSGLRPSLVISDVTMPGTDGIALTRQVRQIVALRFVPILLMSTENEQSRRQEARAAGATGWLVKPVPPDQLLGVLKQVIPGT